MRIIRRYLFKTVAANVGIVLLVILALSGFINLIGQIGLLEPGKYNLLQAGYYVLLRLPATAFDALPMAALIGALLGLGSLAAHSEIIVLRAAGVSSVRLAMAVASTGLVLALITLAVGEFFGPSLERYALQYRALARSGQAGLNFGTAAWVRDGNTFIHLSAPDANFRYGGVLMFDVEDNQLVSVAHADSVDIGQQGQWVMNNFTETRFLEDGVAAYQVPRLLEPKHLDSELLALMRVRPTSLSGQRLYWYIEYLRANGLDAKRYELTFWARIASALAVVPMCVLALPFSFGALRSSGTGGRMLVGVMIGLVYFIGSKTFLDGGAVFGIAPAIVAFLPTVLLAAVAGIMLARAR